MISLQMSSILYKFVSDSLIQQLGAVVA